MLQVHWRMPIVAAAATIVFGGTATALVVAPGPSLPDRIEAAEIIIAGKVISFDDKDIEAWPFRDAPKKFVYRIAVVKVIEPLKGAAKAATVRIGFPAPPEKQKGGSIRPRPHFGVVLEAGQESLFYLKKHFQEDFLVIPMFYDEVPSKNPNYRREVELIRHALKFDGNLAKGLESKDARDRYYAAALLLYRFRSTHSGAAKTEPIDAKVSQGILAALLEADWNKVELVPPANLFRLLGLTKEDGWIGPAKGSAAEQYAAARAWLREYGSSYRIQRFVDENEGDKKQGDKKVDKK